MTKRHPNLMNMEQAMSNSAKVTAWNNGQPGNDDGHAETKLREAINKYEFAGDISRKCEIHLRGSAPL